MILGTQFFYEQTPKFTSFNCHIMLTEESFHGSGGALAGNWAAVMAGEIKFTITRKPLEIQ